MKTHYAQSRVRRCALTVAASLLLAGLATAQTSTDFSNVRTKWRAALIGDTADANWNTGAIATKITGLKTQADAVWGDFINTSATVPNLTDGTAQLFTSGSGRQLPANKNNVSYDKALQATFEDLETLAIAYMTPGTTGHYNVATVKDKVVASIDWLCYNHYKSGAFINNFYQWRIAIPHSLGNTLTLLYSSFTATQLGRCAGSVDAFVPIPAGSNPNPADGLMTAANRADLCKGMFLRGINGPRSNQTEIDLDKQKVLDALAGLSNTANGGGASVFLYQTALTNDGVGNRATDGMWADGGFIQHQPGGGALPYAGGYGNAYLSSIVDIMYLVDGGYSGWQLGAPNKTHIYDQALNGYAPFMFNGAMMDATRGRKIVTSTNLKQGAQVVQNFSRLAQFAPSSYSDVFKSYIKSWHNQTTYDFDNDVTTTIKTYQEVAAIEATSDLIVPPFGNSKENLVFGSMDRAVHYRSYTSGTTHTWGFALAMRSSRIANYECAPAPTDPNQGRENLKGWYTAEGMTQVYVDDDPWQFASSTSVNDNFWYTVDYLRLPGTTVDKTDITSTKSGTNGHRIYSPNSWVGGASLTADSDNLTGYGAAGMHLSSAYTPNVTGKKSWFMLDDGVFCLGAGIAPATSNTETIFDNRRLANAGGNLSIMTINNGATGSAGTAVLASGFPGTNPVLSNWNSTRWVHLAGKTSAGGIGYFFPSSVNLRGKRERRTGSQHDVFKDGSTQNHTADYGTFSVDHNGPSTYQYLILPGKTEVQMRTYASPYAVLSNSTNLQAVQTAPGTGVVAANFWVANSANPLTASAIGPGVTVKCNQPASAVIRRPASPAKTLEVALADPTWGASGNIVLTITGCYCTDVSRRDKRVTIDQGTVGNKRIILTYNLTGANGLGTTAQVNLTGLEF